MTTKYKRMPSSYSVGTSFITFVESNFTTLEQLFGEPGLGERYKITCIWTLKDEKNNIVTIYDYKQTSFYFPELPSPAELRMNKKISWSIGGNNKSSGMNLRYYIESNEMKKQKPQTEVLKIPDFPELKWFTNECLKDFIILERKLYEKNATIFMNKLLKLLRGRRAAVFVEYKGTNYLLSEIDDESKRLNQNDLILYYSSEYIVPIIAEISILNYRNQILNSFKIKGHDKSFFSHEHFFCRLDRVE